ncbi:cupin domain-containing protein [Marivita sp. S2033]|uniref:cupin domain-containing protein n=1 Tax=Marivita sp. S2033 TaxID=3373187 RepID=UPI0039828BFE
MVECIVPPGLGAPPNHHAGETETFFVIDGELEFMVAGETICAKAGESVNFFLVADGEANHCAISIGRRLFIEGLCNGEGKILAEPVGHALRRSHALKPRVCK